MHVFSEIKTRDTLSKLLNIPLKKLTYILYVRKPNSYYVSFKINKSDGTERNINAPTGDLKKVQIKLTHYLYTHRRSVNEANNTRVNISHGFEENKSIITNARGHINKKYLINIDLEDFFDSFHFGRVRGFFEKNKYLTIPIDIATILAQLVCYEGTLPQGAPTSPIITNMICDILDRRIINIAKKYRLYYTRYADDLTFSTNDKKIQDRYDCFLEELETEIVNFGLSINHKKTRLVYNDSRQEVTGVIVNKKLNINHDYYKKTRAMANSLYSTGEFIINGELGNSNQLEGRFSFVDNLDRYNNVHNSAKKNIWILNGREREYQKFLFYKYFCRNEKPVVLTEGKTDQIYIKAALKRLYKAYPKLVEKNDNRFSFKINFFKKTKRMEYFFKIKPNGGDTLINIFNMYTGSNGLPNYYDYFTLKNEMLSQNPIFVLLDNEQKHKDKPLNKLKNSIGIKDEIINSKNFKGNLYILTNPLVKGLDECEIEDLFDDQVLGLKLGNKSFSREKNYDKNEFYGKKIFSEYIMDNYETIDFDLFKPLLDEITRIAEQHATTD